MGCYEGLKLLYSDFKNRKQEFLNKKILSLSYKGRDILFVFESIADKSAMAQTVENNKDIFVIFNKKFYKVLKKSDYLLEMVTLHELTHVIQNITWDYDLDQFFFADDYWNLPQEIEAYTIVLLQLIAEEQYGKAIKYLEQDYPEFLEVLNFKKFIKKANRWNVPPANLNEFFRSYRDYLTICEQFNEK